MVAPAVVAAGIGALGNLVGGLFGNSAAKKAAAREDYYAHNGIRIKVKDARAAGIHPLYALGASTYQPSGTVVNPLGEGLAGASQDIGRAVAAGMSPEEKVSSFQNEYNALQLQNMSLQNERLASEIRLINQPGSPPGMPVSDPSDPLKVFGAEVLRSPTSSNAQLWQDRHGDVIENIVGPAILMDDLRHSGYGLTLGDIKDLIFGDTSVRRDPPPMDRFVGGRWVRG